MDGTVLAQYDGTNNIYFQYSNGVPVGFIHNDVQYLYITNLSGDVVGITDADGNLIAEYTYDEWGKLLSIETAEENNEEQLAIAETNPLRYRGYYYDNETGMYYLQSRYYNPEMGRFISADGFMYINCNKPLNINVYIYCVNNPVKFIDPNGTDYVVSPAGQAIVDLIQILFITDYAYSLGGEAFACSIATYFTLNVSELHIDYSPKDSKKVIQAKKNQAQINIMGKVNAMLNDFKDFMETSIYKTAESFNKVLKVFGRNIYVELFNKCMEEKSLYSTLNITKYFSFSFGYGNENSAASILKNALKGKYEMYNNPDSEFSWGFTKNGSNLGVYGSYGKDINDGFSASMDFGAEFDFDDLISNMCEINGGPEILFIVSGIVFIVILVCAIVVTAFGFVVV